ncbi:MAG: ABC transporter ATP-binding protein/permease [Clostridiales bacterium]|jgi:ATP-binding cassette subfamily B protein|nr:ABC transporter ATP-binding protein/permease [Clostridiales bacterium]
MAEDPKGGFKQSNTQATDFFGGYGRTDAADLSVTDKPANFKKTFKQLVKSLSLYKYLILIACLCAAVSTIFVVFAPKLMATLTDDIFNGLTEMISSGGGLLDGAFKDGIFLKLRDLFLLYLFGALFMYFQGFIMVSVSQKTSLKMRSDINKKISKLPVGYFDKHSHGDLLSRITNDVDTVSNTLNHGLTQIVTAVTTIIGITAMMITLNVLLTLVVLFTLPLSYIAIRIIAKRSQKRFVEQQNYIGEVNGYIEEIYGGHSVIKAFGMERDSEKKFNKINEKLYETAWMPQALSGIIYPLLVFISNLGCVAIIVLGAYLVIIDSSNPLLAFSIGSIYAFVQYDQLFTTPINQTAQTSSLFQSAVAAAERIYAFLNGEEEETPKQPEKMPDINDIKGEIIFENLTFGYDKDTPILKNLNLKIPAGSRVAIVGQTGSGKTTIVKLLMRFYNADEGRILLDGKDIALYDKKEYTKNIAMVLQDIWLFNGTIMENIRYGRLDATDEDVRTAAVTAGADKFISALKDGYNTVINEEAGNLSEGQKQLLSIARAMVKRSKVIIFDEATSSIDTLTERIVQDAVEKITRDKTCFVIAHRLSTIINSDMILVMQDGELKESGTHKELLEKRGLYALIYNTQFSKNA